MYASPWMFERPFGAMCGLRGGSGANTGAGLAGLPMKAGSEFGPSGIGIANAEGAVAVAATRTPAIHAAVRIRRAPPTAPPGPERRLPARDVGVRATRCARSHRPEQVGASRVAQHALVAR